MPVKTLAAAALAVCLSSLPAFGQSDRPLRLDPGRLARIDALVAEAMEARLLPGAVVLVGQGDRVVYEGVFGHRALEPAVEPMTPDTMFDLASLTKVVVTTTAVMQLVEQGRIRLTDRVAAHLPGFERHGKRDITIRHLLTHVGGLRPDVDLAEPWEGTETALALARAEVPVAAPGERFIYSDIGFFVLGAIVERVSGERLADYAERHLFGPLGMRDTSYLPAPATHRRIAPTERCAFLDEWPCRTAGAAALRGVVHDPTTRRMGGVSGHAGIFGTAHDLARFARMLLGGGALDGVRVLSPLSVAKMTSPATPPGMRSVRALGWDIDTSYSSNRGELLPVGSYGHTGFTGTSLWIDPDRGTWTVLLTNRSVVPRGPNRMQALRRTVHTNVIRAAE
jgi:CubicO group peptidase (beta-lactamase class C family)